ncbi:putative zinc finger and SCAN domain-containing protein 5D [Conger conger]|uniref:putative zinc finger and SCAN domain-containing protein 5D n=1 Tax=Conger conger TaxID=82655 RepID=UPI002A599910|nr:putative zinc finger and SCAN domain-containing protein 5D [Conger conger]
MISPNSMNAINPRSNRKQGILSTPIRSSGQSFERKGEKTESLQPVLWETKLSISSLKIRLAPTIKNTLATAVDSLLSEVAVVLDDALTKTQQELVTQEQENQRLRLRLEVSEGELKVLQECLCSAQKILDHRPPSLSGLGTLGQHGFASSAPSACGGNNVVRCNGSESFSNETEDDRDISDLPMSNSENRGSFIDALQGMDSGKDLKVCPLSIQADGTVSSNLLNTFSTSSPSTWSDIARTDKCAAEQMGRPRLLEKEPTSSGLRPEPRVQIKQEQDQGAGLHGRGAAGEGGGPLAPEAEQTAQNVAELGYIHVVEEEDASRSHSRPVQLQKPSQLPLQWLHKGGGAPFSDGLKTLEKPHPGSRLGQMPSRGPVGTGGPPPTAGPATEGGERPHLCLQCGKTFRLISSLKKHIRIHTGEKPYPCPVCGRCFRESGALKTHQRIHTGEKPYTCSECGTCFRHLDGLRKHRRTHTGEKPYVCGMCGKRLSRLQHLKHHQRIHTGERPCCCPRCHKSFKEPAALRKHLRTHREEPGGGETASEDPAEVGGSPGAVGNVSRLHHLMLPPQMGFGAWGGDGEDGAMMNCV